MMHVFFYAFYILCFIVQHFGRNSQIFFCLDFDLVTAAQTQAPNTKDESGCNIVSLCYGGRKWSTSLILFHRVVYIKRLFPLVSEYSEDSNTVYFSSASLI